MNIYLNSSDISIITGSNKYGNIINIVLKLWKKYYYKDYIFYNNIIQRDKIYTNRESYLLNKYNIDFNNIDLNNIELYKQNEITKLKLKIKNKDILNELIKILNNKINCNYGIKNESNFIKYYNNINNNNNIEIDNTYYKKNIYNTKNNWYLIGFIDGYNNNDNCVIEIKSRVYKLFNIIKDYEKDQIYCYMYLTNKKKCKLIEFFQKNNKIIYNEDIVLFNINYWYYLKTKIIHFIHFFENIFMKNKYLKIKILFLI